VRSILSIILFSCFCCHSLPSQNIHQLKAYADEQFHRGNLSSALKEYQRILFFDTRHQYESVYSDMAELYFEQEDFENALVYYDFARKAIPCDSLKLEYSFQKILCYFRQGSYLLGLSDLYGLPGTLSPHFEAKKNLYLAICHFGMDDTGQSLQYFAEIVDSTGLERISSLFRAYEKHKKKYDPDKLEMMSIFIPGLGQFVAGDVKNGLNSIFLLTGIAAYSFYTMRIYGILDGTLVLVTWFYRYYTGGHKKAYELGVTKIREQQRITYDQILEIVRRHPSH
jgi:tetratricopeptide (TPR) repeat protein